MNLRIKKEKSCGLVLFYLNAESKRQYLLLHYPGGHWDFPKGHVEENETEIETAHRELEEETGIKDIKIFPGFRFPSGYKYRFKDKLIDKEVIYFCAETKTQDIVLSHEHQGFDWLDYQAALERITFDNSRQLLIEADNFLNTVK